MFRLALFVVVCGTTVALLGADDALPKAEIAKRGKAATALVEVKGRGTGSGFCVHPSGIFVTNEHVVGPAGKAVLLVLNSGLKNQNVVPAKVGRADKTHDLAILRVDATGAFPTLPLGTVDDITELAEVVAVGFPFGRLLAADVTKEYPTASVNTGSVTALRLRDGELDHFQVDVALNPGNSGGPVLDTRGRVVGVVVSGIRGAAGINQAIPVSHLAKFLAEPELTLDPPKLTDANCNTPLPFKARMTVFVPGATDPELRLLLRAGDDEPRTFVMKKEVDGLYTAAAAPVPPPVKAGLSEITARYGSGLVTGQVGDFEFQVGDKPVKLSATRRVEFKPRPRVVLEDGKTILEGAITGVGAVPVAVGTLQVALDLSAADSVETRSKAEVGVVTATLVAVAGGKEVGRLLTQLPIRAAQQVAAEQAIADGTLIAESGFNDAKGINANPQPDSPFPLGKRGVEGGQGEPGWETNWAGLGLDRVEYQSEVVYEGDGALRIHGGTVQPHRRLSKPQTKALLIEQYVRVPSGGGFKAYVMGSDGQTTLCGPHWGAEGGQFRVFDGDERGSGRWVDTGIDCVPDKWYKAVVLTDVKNHRWEFAVNDKKYEHTDLHFRGRPDAIQGVNFLVENAGGMYLDALRILPAPEGAFKK
ncbi:S1C family serine protease [Fimbriiglobus ruber]|uniref:HtrA protease/chaperone protein n=1 Tax=Fimbriiglobus ruber TaxID=1908690 RepID=A0A225D8U1_9BACT|nr:serine protease [Fimbriiglobus ruber]OWK38030.1 HtrA protease/chaperone protein [Fimbriiglobus ruber]